MKMPTARPVSPLAPLRCAAGALLLAILVAGGAPLPALAPPARPAPSASRHLAELLKRIEADQRNQPSASVAWAKEALALLGPGQDPKAEIGFLLGLLRDLNTLEAYAQAAPYLDQARRAAALSGDPRAAFAVEVEAAALASNQDKVEETRALMTALLPALEAFRAKSPRDGELANLLTRSYRILGGAYQNQGRLQEAIEAYRKGQKVCEEVGDRRGHARILDQVGSLYAQLNRFQEAESTHQTAIALAQALGNLDLEAACRLSFAKTLGLMNATDRELEELLRTSNLAARAQDSGTQAIAAVNLADVYLRKRDYRTTLKYADAALERALANHTPTSVAVCRVNRGIALNRLGHSAEGIKSILEGLEHFRKIQVISDLTEITGNLAEEYAFNGDYRNAYETERQFKALSDSWKRSKDLKVIAEATAAFESDKRQIQIEALQRDQVSQARQRRLWIALGGLGFLAAAGLIVSRRQLQKANAALAEMSLKDPLTALPNRRYLATRIAEDLAQILRLRRDPQGAAARLVVNLDITFLMIDLDHFKEVNDRYGHAAGDKVLRQFAGLLGQVMRESDTVVRWGGEEFLVVAKPTSHLDAHLVAERIRSQVEAFPFDLGEDPPLRLTCSIGFSSYPFYRSTPNQLAWEAVAEVSDRCLYAAKAMGRNTWVGVHEAAGGAAPGPLDVGEGLDVADLVQRGVLTVETRDNQPVSWPRSPLL